MSKLKMNIGDIFPNFKVNTTQGPIEFHPWLGEDWGVLFSHPADYTPVCTTELSRLAKLVPEFRKRHVKVIGLSCNDVKSHLAWIEDIKSYGYLTDWDFPYPIIDDDSRELAVKLNMLDKSDINAKGLPLTCRAVFVIDHYKKLRLSILYPATTGRNFDEILRVIDSMQLTDKYKVATPSDWKRGDECMVLPYIPEKVLPDMFPKGVVQTSVPSGKPYIRVTPCPNFFVFD